MKKYYFIIALLVACSIFVWSCKKDHKQLQPVETSNKKTYNVTLGVSGSNFTQQITNATTNKMHSLATAASDSASLAGIIDKLYIYIVDSHGYTKYKAAQTKSDVGFGSVKTALAPDNYRLYMFGCKDDVNVIYSDATPYSGTNIEVEVHDITNGTTHYSKSWPDSFNYLGNLDVSDDINQSISLYRIICQVKVVFKDAIPASVKSIKLSSRPSIASLNLAIGYFTGYGTGDQAATASVSIPDSLIGKKNFSLYVNTGSDTSYFNPGNYISSEINCYDSNNSTIVTRSLGSIFLYRNQQAIYTIDNMFGGITTPQNASFQVSVNTGWKPTVITQPF
ncbi:hypothetical protein ACEN9X_18880 [Mucilaginibacter sp. Mucisp86]|uniref:hypothetical protein n=1 Tax=Mucilaginibacter sp. Mucisp86 TaxID=3243060 RepID=UPI0039B51E50